MPLHTTHLYPGEFHSFGLGILNILEGTKDFTIEITLSKAFDQEENMMDPIPDTSGWLLFLPGPYPIEENEYQFIPLGVEIPKATKKGNYIFDVKVSSENERYGNIKKLYVVVK